MKLLVTGAAGFIGSYVCRNLLERGDEVIGLGQYQHLLRCDLKYGRLATLGIIREEVDWYKFCAEYPVSLIPFRADEPGGQAGCPYAVLPTNIWTGVVNLAAQAGVRYSIENPYAYVESNVDGFLNILEGCPGTMESSTWYMPVPAACMG